MWNRSLIVGVSILLMTSCASKKRVNTPVGDKTVNKEIIAEGDKKDYALNNLDFHTFSGRAKAKLDIAGDKQDATLHLRIQRNKAIWMSVTASILNLEGIRILITPDSIKVLNKLQGEYLAKPFSFIYEYTGNGLSFNNLQDLLIANVSKELLRTDQLTIAQANDDTQLVGIKDEVSFQYSLNSKFRPKVFRLQTSNLNQGVEVLYGSFNNVTGYDFPQRQQIKLSTISTQINTQLDYNKIEFNQDLEMPFSVPAKYKVLD